MLEKLSWLFKIVIGQQWLNCPLLYSLWNTHKRDRLTHLWKIRLIVMRFLEWFLPWQFDGALLPAYYALLFTTEKPSRFVSGREELKFPVTLRSLAQRHGSSTRGPCTMLVLFSFSSHFMLLSNHNSQKVVYRPWRESGNAILKEDIQVCKLRQNHEESW